MQSREAARALATTTYRWMFLREETGIPLPSREEFELHFWHLARKVRSAPAWTAGRKPAG
jgi:hypothetical protein